MMEAADIIAENRRRVNVAAGSARLLGVLFVMLGGVPMLGAVVGLERGFWVQVLAAVDTLVLTGPGVWYFVAGGMMKRGQRRAAALSLWIAGVQLGLVVMMMCLPVLLGWRIWLLQLPACLALFFVPALVAFLVQLTRGWRALAVLGAGEAFEPVHVRPAEGMQEPAIADEAEEA